MGKQAKKRTEQRRQHEKQHREAQRTVDRRLLDALAVLGDPLSAVHALTSSPMGLHRHLTLSRAVQVALQAAAANRLPGAARSGLPSVLDVLADDAARFAFLEDAVPLDPRLPAVGRFGGQLYRLYPGMLERPVAALRTAELVAIAADPTLVPHYGFGLGDLMTVCLTHMDPGGEPTRPGLARRCPSQDRRASCGDPCRSSGSRQSSRVAWPWFLSPSLRKVGLSAAVGNGGACETAGTFTAGHH